MHLTNIRQKIYFIRGERVMLDFDLAALHEVETKILNQSVKRNLTRFPDDFMFQLTETEWTDLRSQFVTSNWGDLGSNFYTANKLLPTSCNSSEPDQHFITLRESALHYKELGKRKRRRFQQKGKNRL